MTICETRPALDNPALFDKPSSGGDSIVQSLLRGGPHNGENWDQGMVAVIAARAEAAGLRVATGAARMPGGDHFVLLAPPSLAISGGFFLPDDEIERWAQLPNHTSRGGDRTGLLDGCVNGLRVTLANPARMLGQPFFKANDTPDGEHPHVEQYRLIMEASLRMWWGARLDSGFTPEFAETMLALTAHPTLMSRVQRVEGGLPRVLHAPQR